MENVDITRPKNNYTKLPESIYDYVSKKIISLRDVVVYACIKTQYEGKYDTSSSSISRIYKMNKQTIQKSISSLKDAGLIKVDSRGKKHKINVLNIEGIDFDNIPKVLLMSSDLNIRDKEFLLASWGCIEDNRYYGTKKALFNDAFKSLNVSLRWVETRMSELTEKEFLRHIAKEKCYEISIQKVFLMSDTVIDSKLGIIKEYEEQLEEAEGVIVSYETKTGVSRDKVAIWEPNESDKDKASKAPNWLEPVVEAIDKGCEKVGKKKFVFKTSDYENLGKQIKETIESNDGDSEERIIAKIIASIEWKAKQASINESDKKYWTKGFFTRKTNNIGKNLYHHTQFMEKNPYHSVAKNIPKINKSVSKPVVVDKNSFAFKDLDEW
jgi:DNA-binding Lrp family transcriptional regulator